MTTSNAESPTRETIFISYAHEDRKTVDDFLKSLRPFERDRGIRRWDDSLIKPGQHWEAEIRHALAGTRIAILFVSRDFMASAYISQNELPPLLKAEAERGLTILPVYLDHCSFRQHPGLSKFQLVNSPDAPVLGMGKLKRSKLWTQLADQILEILNDPSPEATDDPQTHTTASDPTPQLGTSIADVQGVQVGDNNVQINWFPHVQPGRLIAPQGQSTWTTLREYNCWTEQNHGKYEESDGEVRHDYGHEFTDLIDGKTKNVWAWSREKLGLFGKSVLFGPYNDDLTVPGRYRITFRVRGVGFGRVGAGHAHRSVLALDVACTFNNMLLTTDPQFVTAAELSRAGYHDYSIEMSSSVGNRWEYRVGAMDRSDSYNKVILADNISEFEKSGNVVQILFDTITVATLAGSVVPLN